MKWFEITVFTTQEGLEAVAARFDMLGISQVVIEESRESVESFLQEMAQYWDYADIDSIVGSAGPCVRAYAADLSENKELIRNVEASFCALRKEDVGLDLGSLRLVIALRDEEDWANNWKLYYKPMEIGEKILVCPSWEKADAKGRLVLSIDPGMAFGTGSHHTTRMCLEYLEKLVKGNETALDLGCGSGILSIAAILLGAKEATGVDVDPIAEKIARENAMLNGIYNDRYKVFAGNILSDEELKKRLLTKKYDIITANIVADVIIALLPLVKELLAPDGVFISSGIIDERYDEVLAALEKNGFIILDTKASEDWRAIQAKLQ